MKRKLLAICLAYIITLSLAGCGQGSGVIVNVENKETLSGTTFGVNALIEIGSNLWYDSSTRIVYWWSGAIHCSNHGSTTPTPYYAPNGLPYRYNPETNMFEEVSE